MIELDVADLVLIAGRTLGLGTDGALLQLDIPAAQAALAEARQAAWSGDAATGTSQDPRGYRGGGGSAHACAAAPPSVP
jgi:hypothetical protein